MISRFTLLLATAGSSVHGLISGPFAPRRGATSRAAVHMGLAVPLTDFDGARVATLNAGDCVIYDASVLHFGGANSAPGNERSIFYFGLAPLGGAAALAGDGPSPSGYRARPSVRLDELLRGDHCCG